MSSCIRNRIIRAQVRGHFESISSYLRKELDKIVHILFFKDSTDNLHIKVPLLLVIEGLVQYLEEELFCEGQQLELNVYLGMLTERNSTKLLLRYSTP